MSELKRSGSQVGVALFSIRKFRPFFALAQERGVALEALLAEFGTTLSVLLNPETRLPRVTCIAIVRRLLAALRDPLVGLHAAEQFVLQDMDLVGYIAQQHADILSALEAVVGYAPLVGDSSRAELTRAKGEVMLTQWIAGDEPLLPELADYVIASSHRGIAQLAGRRVPALRVELARPAPPAGAVADYHAFFGGPVRFGVQRGALVYAEVVLRQPCGPGDERLAELLLRQARERLVSAARAGSLREQVRAELSALPELADARPTQLARKLGMSERTLRRKLKQLGTSYSHVLDEVREQRARTQLASGRLRIGELAAQLGFDDVTGFTRAFRRWTGMSPSHYQRRLPNTSAPQTPSATAYKPPSSVG